MIRVDSLQNMFDEHRIALSYWTSMTRLILGWITLLNDFRIEKTCAAFLTLFLQVMDEGRLTDGQGRLVDFRWVLANLSPSNIATDTNSQ
jgi:hypothetical protein